MLSPRRHLQLPTLAFLVLAVATTVACAPRVSKRAPAVASGSGAISRPAPARAAAPAYAAASVRSEPVSDAASRAVPARAEPVRAPPPRVEPLASSLRATPEREAGPRPRATPAEEQEEEEEEEEPARPARSAERRSFYAFTDAEIAGLRRQSRDFRRLHDELTRCTARSEREISRREQLREEIIQLQNAEFRTSKQERELAAKRTEERKLKELRGTDSGECQKLEVKLAEMLRART